MIGQCLSNKNESSTVVKSENFYEVNQTRPLFLSHIFGFSVHLFGLLFLTLSSCAAGVQPADELCLYGTTS